MGIAAAADVLRVRPVPVRPNRKDRRPYDPDPPPLLFASTQLYKPLEPPAVTRAFNLNRADFCIADVTAKAPNVDQ